MKCITLAGGEPLPFCNLPSWTAKKPSDDTASRCKILRCRTGRRDCYIHRPSCRTHSQLPSHIELFETNFKLYATVSHHYPTASKRKLTRKHVFLHLMLVRNHHSPPWRYIGIMIFWEENCTSDWWLLWIKSTFIGTRSFLKRDPNWCTRFPSGGVWAASHRISNTWRI